MGTYTIYKRSPNNPKFQNCKLFSFIIINNRMAIPAIVSLQNIFYVLYIQHQNIYIYIYTSLIPSGVSQIAFGFISYYFQFNCFHISLYPLTSLFDQSQAEGTHLISILVYCLMSSMTSFMIFVMHFYTSFHVQTLFFLQ